MFPRSLFLYFSFQPDGKGKYVFDIGCEQHGKYVAIEQVRLCKKSFCTVDMVYSICITNALHYQCKDHSVSETGNLLDFYCSFN